MLKRLPIATAIITLRLFVMRILLILTRRAFLLASRTLLMALVATPLLRILTVLYQLGLLATFLLRAFVKCRGEILQCTDEVNAKITFRFMGFFNRFGNPLNGSGEMFERCVNSLEAGGDALEEFRVGIGFWSAHSVSGKEWAHDSG